jgi:demethylmenaquinone methyltransferase/2-methoxy-6-polyprenyl-1,4-benzoquinol methylase
LPNLTVPSPKEGVSTSKLEIPTKFVDKARFVLGIFTDVEREYDTLLHLMTLTFDAAWRRRMLSKIDFSRQVSVLDLACGTGLVTFDVARSAQTPQMVVGLDLSPAMLRVARKNKSRERTDCPVEFVRAAGEFLPFRGELFDYVTVGLALRNFGDKLAVFKESERVLRPAGRFLSVDFVRPDSARIWPLYRFHIFYVLPAIGRVVSAHWKRTLVYLANSIMIAVPPGEVCKLLGEAALTHPFVKKMSFGIVALIGAQK